MTKQSKSNKLVVIIVCATVIILGGIAGWVYINQQNITQRDRALEQQRELTEYKEDQANKRAEFKAAQEVCRAETENSKSSFGSLFACQKAGKDLE